MEYKFKIIPDAPKNESGPTENDNDGKIYSSKTCLQVIVKQEILRKQGFAIQADEEQLRVQLEALQTELNHPTQFKVRVLLWKI